MNDVEIKDIDKLKNLFIELGIEFKEYNGMNADAICIGDGYYSKEFNFNKDGKFEFIGGFG